MYVVHGFPWNGMMGKRRRRVKRKGHAAQLLCLEGGEAVFTRFLQIFAGCGFALDAPVWFV
jgi:hypothetical protein